MLLNKSRLLVVAAFLTAAVVLLAPGKARADFYRFIDERGILHITNNPRDLEKYEWFRSEKHESSQTEYSSVDILIKAASVKYGVDSGLIKAVMKAESNFDQYAVSRAGATGLMQLMPATAKYLGVKDIHNPKQNVYGGVKYLRYLLDKFEWELPLALAAYNAGEDAVMKYGRKIPPYKETRRYVKKVLGFHKQFTKIGL